MNKLVRDKIPALLRHKGEKFAMHRCQDTEYAQRLCDKLQEEVSEYLQDNCVEELADILEVIQALAEFKFGGIEKVEHVRKKKEAERGGFYDKIVIDKIFDE